MKKLRTVFLAIILALPIVAFGQEKGILSGDLMINNSWYIRDSSIGAFNQPHYDKFLSGADAWMSLNYSLMGFNAGVRFDLFNNSNLHNPGTEFNGQGIGAWYISKKIKELTITGGYIYDQFGSGTIFRAFEDRGLGIDNAIFGVHLRYELNENWHIRAFTGRQKNRFDIHEPIIKGALIEGSINLSDSTTFMIVPGAAAVNRTMDQASMDPIVTELNNYPLEQRFQPKYNVYLFSLYNTLSYKNISLYTEYSAKTDDVYIDFSDSLAMKPGNQIYTSLTYSKKGLGLTLQYKRTENFTFRTSPNEQLFRGLGNFLPPVARQNTYRLLSRYGPATQDVGEQGVQLDLTYSLKKWLVLTVNYSEIAQLSNQIRRNITPEFTPESLPATDIFGRRPWYRELYFDLEIRKSRKFKAIVGNQFIIYDQDFYQAKPGKEVVEAVVPFTEMTYKLTRRKSLRWELSYMITDEDEGDWLFALLEYNTAPKWSFGTSYMYSSKPTKKGNDIVYPSVYASFTKHATKFILSYVKQVEGIVCTGGVCRLEPAFSGVRLSLTTSF